MAKSRLRKSIINNNDNKDILNFLKTPRHLGGESLHPANIQEMIKNYHQSDGSLKNSEGEVLVAVDFDKSGILEILGQDFCEGIRLYIGLDNNKQPRIIVVGLDEDHRDLAFRFDRGDGTSGFFLRDEEVGTQSLIKADKSIVIRINDNEELADDKLLLLKVKLS